MEDIATVAGKGKSHQSFWSSAFSQIFILCWPTPSTIFHERHTERKIELKLSVKWGRLISVGPDGSKIKMHDNFQHTLFSGVTCAVKGACYIEVFVWMEFSISLQHGAVVECVGVWQEWNINYVCYILLEWIVYICLCGSVYIKVGGKYANFMVECGSTGGSKCSKGKLVAFQGVGSWRNTTICRKLWNWGCI